MIALTSRRPWNLRLLVKRFKSFPDSWQISASSLWTFLNIFECFRIGSDPFGCIWVHADATEAFWMRPKFWKMSIFSFSESCSTFFNFLCLNIVSKNLTNNKRTKQNILRWKRKTTMHKSRTKYFVLFFCLIIFRLRLKICCFVTLFGYLSYKCFVWDL